MAGGDLLEKFYSVTKNGKACGKVSVRKQGLYYRFHCRCAVDREDIYRLILSWDGFQESLGILVPDEGSFVLTCSLPVRRVGEGDWRFHIAAKQETTSGCFVPICPEEPFGYISRLKESFLVCQDGQPGILISKKQE